MSKPLKPFQLINLGLIVLALSACASNGAQPTTQLNPYLEETKAIELQAINALQLGNYQLAQRLYKRAYAAYSAVDETNAMARQLINQAQVALIVEDLIVADAAIESLASHITIYQQSQHADRLNLLRGNLAIAKQDWNVALDYFQKVKPSATGSIYESSSVSQMVARWGLGEPLQEDRSRYLEIRSSLSRARLARLIAEQAIAANNASQAADYLVEANDLYRQAAFAPGIAEVLVLSAKLAELNSDLEKALALKKRAKEIYRRIGNSRAIQRHQL